MSRTSGLIEFATNHPEAACYFDLPSRQMTLNSGATAPVVGIYDVDGEKLEDDEIDLCDTILIAFGPTPSGYMLRVHARVSSKNGASYQA